MTFSSRGSTPTTSAASTLTPASKSTGFVAWHRLDDNRVVVWAGNDADFDMTNLAEVSVA